MFAGVVLLWIDILRGIIWLFLLDVFVDTQIRNLKIMKPEEALTYVPPAGDISSAKLAIVGEQPGRQEVAARNREPFIGPAGEELNKCLTLAGISRSDCYLTNVFKDLDRPLKAYADLSKKPPRISEVGENYISSLIWELEDGPDVIMAVGNVALYALSGIVGITKWRGSIIRGYFRDKFVVPCIHPATVIPPKFQYLNKWLIAYDLQKAWEIACGKYVPTQRTLHTAPTFLHTQRFLDYCYSEGKAGKTVHFDIEVNEEVTCISLAIGLTAMSIPFCNADGNYFKPEQELAIWLKLAQILEDPAIQKGGQNLSFDSHFLLRKYGIKVKFPDGIPDDTMIAQKILMPDYKANLGFVTSIWTDHPYYKDEGKRYFKGGGWQQLWTYNATDSVITSEVFPRQGERLTSQGNLETYNRQARLTEVLVYMQEHGIKADMKKVRQSYEVMTQDIEDYQHALEWIASKPLNAQSPKQLMEYFYKDLGFKPYKDKGKPTTNDDAMKRLRRRGVIEAFLVQQIRGTNKLRSTYLDPKKYDADGRIRCSFNPIGTPYGRLSSSESIFGTGINFQNIPEGIRDHYLADDGYILYSFDESQGENRIVAYVGQVEAMIEAFETGKDVHKLTAALIFNKDPDDISTAKGSSKLGDGKHSERDWGKRANHALNYGMGYRLFALEYEIPDNEGKIIVNGYHKAYPGVQDTFQQHVKDCLYANRTLINLRGRKTVFMGNRRDNKVLKSAYSCIPQGTISDIINELGLEYIYFDQEQFGQIELLNQVHDDIKFQIPLALPLREHARMLLAIKKSLEVPLHANGRTFVIPSDLQIGFDMSKKNSRELKGASFPSDEHELAKELKHILRELGHEAEI